MMAARSSGLISNQAPISARVRPQPRQVSPLASSWQMFTQGEAMAVMLLF